MDSPKLHSVRVSLSVTLKATACQHTSGGVMENDPSENSAFLSAEDLTDPHCLTAPAWIGSPLKTLASRLLALLRLPQLKQRVDHPSICATRK